MNNSAEAIDLGGKKILITGASSGIGRQCAIHASRLGANVVLLARNADRLDETLRLMEKGNHSVYSLDVTEIDKIPVVIEESFSRSGKFTGFVHSAGIEMTLPMKFMKKGQYDKLFVVNAISGFEFARVLSNKKYVNERGASFVFIASVMSMVGSIGKVGYCASKGAIVAGMKSLALELAANKIRVNSISPGMVETEMAKNLFAGIPNEAKKKIIDMHPLGLGQPEDIANLCMFLLLDSSRWITGTNMVIDGGYSAH